MRHDLRYAIRQILRSPGFTAMAVLSLALGIGANTAIFSLVNALILRTLPVARPHELVTVSSKLSPTLTVNSFSLPYYRDLRDRNDVFSGLLARAEASVTLTNPDSAEILRGERVSGNYFDLLGVQPAAGRLLVPGDDAEGTEPVCVLSYALWTRRFGAERSAIGKHAVFNNQPFTVVGIAPPAFTGSDPGRAVDLFLAIATSRSISPRASSTDSRGVAWLSLIGRLKPGVTRERAQASLDALAQQLKPDQKRGAHILLDSGAQGLASLRKQYKLPLLILMAVVGAVLLIACTNIANLLLARAAARQKEISIRQAVGAGRGRLIRQLLVESLMLAVLGGACGLLLASWGAEALVALVPRGAAWQLNVEPDLAVLLFTLVLSTLVGVMFGLVPALAATRAAIAPLLRSASGSGRSGSLWGRKTMVAVQVTLSVVLLAGAALLLATLHNLRTLPIGFEKQSVAMMQVHTESTTYPDSQRRAIFDQLLRRATQLPGVQAASLASISPMAGGAWMWSAVAEGYQEKPGEFTTTYGNYVSPGFFATIGQPLLMGRDFTVTDRQGAPKVAIVNQSLARHFWPGQNPIGKRIGVGSDDPDSEVIGVVADAKYRDLRAAAPLTSYQPIGQLESVGGLTLHVRTTGDPRQVLLLLRDEVRGIDKRLPLSAGTTMDAQIDATLGVERMLSTLTAGFGGLALLLAVIGLYGVMSYSVARRTREIGIRIALGAPGPQVLGMVLKESLAPVLIGLAAGIPAARAASEILHSFLFGLDATNTGLYILVSLTLLTAATAAILIPARRAARIDPMLALRQE